MLKTKSLVFLGLTLIASLTYASDALYFFKPANRIGCGTITSLRNVNQAPLYDREYEMLVAGRAGTQGIAFVASDLGIVGQVAGQVASYAVDAVRGPSVAVEGVTPPKDGVWTNVQAVRVTMDDGSIMNLPLTAQPKLAPGSRYEEGRRVVVFLLKERDSIQLGLTGKAPLPDEKLYNAYCSQRVEAGEAAAALKRNANIVQEVNIIN